MFGSFLIPLSGDTILLPQTISRLSKEPYNYACQECHSYLPPDMKKREMQIEHVNFQLAHGEQWCYDCHQNEPFFKSLLAGSELVSWAKMNEHCGSCHEKAYQDWRFGAHGRRTGAWKNGLRYGLNCTECHNAHYPKFPPRKPLAPPNTSFLRRPSE